MRGLADLEAATLLDAALDHLDRVEGPLPPVMLVSMSSADVAVHFEQPAAQVPSGWRAEDGGRTIVVPRTEVGDLPAFPDDRPSAPRILVSLGTSAQGQRRVLLNLARVGMLGIDADPQTHRTVLLSNAAELATSAPAAGLLVMAVGLGDALTALERIEPVEEPSEAVGFLEKVAGHAAAREDDPPEEAAVGLFSDPPGDDLEEHRCGGRGREGRCRGRPARIGGHPVPTHRPG